MMDEQRCGRVSFDYRLCQAAMRNPIVSALMNTSPTMPALDERELAITAVVELTRENERLLAELRRVKFRGAPCRVCADLGEIKEGTGETSLDGDEVWRVVPCPECRGPVAWARTPPTACLGEQADALQEEMLHQASLRATAEELLSKLRPYAEALFVGASNVRAWPAQTVEHLGGITKLKDFLEELDLLCLEKKED